MLITILGIRGTVPSENSGTVGLLVNNKYAFDVPPEFIQSVLQARSRWNQLIRSGELPKEFRSYPAPNLSKIEHVFISHFHWDHWGGLAHYVRWFRLFQRDWRKEQPLHVYIPKDSMLPFKYNFIESWSLDEDHILSLPDHEFLQRFLSIELHESFSELVRFHVIAPRQPVHLVNDGLKVTSIETGHLPRGSVAFRIEQCKEKVNLEKVRELGLQPGPIIGKIKNAPEGLEIQGKRIYKNDIMFKDCVVTCYSGDSPINDDLITFYQNADVLIHDTTYLSAKEGYYLERHADLEHLVDFCKKIQNLKLLVPIHFSHRHELSEIKEKIVNIMENDNLPYDMLLPKPCTFILLKKGKIMRI